MMTTPASRAPLRSPRLHAGDRVRLVSPASFPDRASLATSVRVLESWGLVVEVGEHAMDRWGYMAGRDEDRLADLNGAFRDPGVRAIITTRGGAGAYRIADGIDFAAVRADPKPLVGFSDVTNLHLALWHGASLTGIHGCLAGERSCASVRALLMNGETVTLHRDPGALTAAVAVSGVARGRLLGGNLRTLAGFVGAGLPDFKGAIVLLEDERTRGLGQVDRELTQLRRSGALDGIAALALGSCPGFEGYEDRGWTLLDVLQDRLCDLGVPVLGGLDVGHVPDPIAFPLGPDALLDATTGTLAIQSCVE
jgi:muramoyltetrapeptide carboxypeptidase